MDEALSWIFLLILAYTWQEFTFFLLLVHVSFLIYSFFNPDISLVGRAFDNCPGGPGSIPDRVIPKTLKMVRDTSLLNTQHNKGRIKVKEKQSRERISALAYASV